MPSKRSRKVFRRIPARKARKRRKTKKVRKNKSKTRKWCTAKVAKKCSNKKKCLKRGCKWRYDYNCKTKDKICCNKISTAERVFREKKKNYCGKYFKKYNVDKKGCKKDKKCRFLDMGSGGEWCLDVKK